MNTITKFFLNDESTLFLKKSSQLTSKQTFVILKLVVIV